jgi:ABC-type phosphate/phosphonate transport system permease subunit
VVAAQHRDHPPEFLYDAPQQTVDLFARMWPIDWAWYPKVVNAALLETLHTRDARHDSRGRDGKPCRAMVARNITRSIILNTIGRFILVATRSVHAMIWALPFVAAWSRRARRDDGDRHAFDRFHR